MPKLEIVEPQDFIDAAASHLLNISSQLERSWTKEHTDKANKNIRKAVKALKKAYEEVR